MKIESSLARMEIMEIYWYDCVQRITPRALYISSNTTCTSCVEIIFNIWLSLLDRSTICLLFQTCYGCRGLDTSSDGRGFDSWPSYTEGNGNQPTYASLLWMRNDFQSKNKGKELIKSSRIWFLILLTTFYCDETFLNVHWKSFQIHCARQT